MLLLQIINSLERISPRMLAILSSFAGICGEIDTWAEELALAKAFIKALANNVLDILFCCAMQEQHFIRVGVQIGIIEQLVKFLDLRCKPACPRAILSLPKIVSKSLPGEITSPRMAIFMALFY